MNEIVCHKHWCSKCKVEWLCNGNPHVGCKICDLESRNAELVAACEAARDILNGESHFDEPTLLAQINSALAKGDE